MTLDIGHPTLNRGLGERRCQPGPDLGRALACAVTDGEGGQW